MQENLPVERLVRKALRAEEPIGRPGIRQLGIPQGAKRLEERCADRLGLSASEITVGVQHMVMRTSLGIF